MINRGDIKLAIDMVVNAKDDNLFGGEAEYVINTLEDCGNEISKLREQVATQAAVIEKFRKHMKWNKRIKNLVDQLLSTDGYHEESLPRYHLSLMNFDCITIPTDSTQILDEVRRADRERVAERAEAYAYMSQNFIALAEEIRAME